MGLDDVLRVVLKEITPTKQEKAEMLGVTDKVLEATDSVIKPLGLSWTLAGSFIRDTWLTHKKEFDLFILFPEDYAREKLEKMGLEVGKNIIKKLKGSFVIAYAEHPYVRSKINGYDVDIVPCYNVKSAEKIKSAVDRTPFHNKYLQKKLPPKLSPDVRLLKQFTKAIGVYGSDLKTCGFSGYLCELLTIKFGSFKKLLEAVHNWVPGNVFIDMSKKYRGNKKEFRDQPLIVIDPVDPKRNVAAALSPANFINFIQGCKKLYDKPTKKMFWKEPKYLGKAQFNKIVKQRGTKFIGITFSRPDIVDDILYPQLRKTTRRLADILKEYEFKAIGQLAWTDDKNCAVVLELEVWELPNIRRVTGPSIFALKNAENFKNKYRPFGKVWVEDLYWTTEIRRRFKTAEIKLKDSLSDPLVQLKAKGIPSNPAKSISKKFKIIDAKGIGELLKNKDFSEQMAEWIGD